MSYSDNGKERTYIPDFWVSRPDKQIVVEVKPVTKVTKRENLILFKHISALCQQQGMEFVVVTDTMIRIQPKLNNIKLLHKYARCPLSIELLLECQRYFLKRKATPIKQACLELEPTGISLNHLFCLLYFGFLSTDLMQPINTNSLIQLSQIQGNITANFLKHEKNSTTTRTAFLATWT